MLRTLRDLLPYKHSNKIWGKAAAGGARGGVQRSGRGKGQHCYSSEAKVPEVLFYKDKGVEIRLEALKGRHLVASRDISAGTTVLKSSPYIWIPHLDKSEHYCYRCFKFLGFEKLASLSVESRYYCSKECRHANYYFDRVSKGAYLSLLNFLSTQVDSMEREDYIALHDDLHFLLNFVVTYHIETSNIKLPNKSSLSFSDFESLVTNQELHEKDAGEYYNNLVAGFMNIMGDIKIMENLSINFLKEAFYRIQSNTHQYGEANIGSGVYPAVAFINHNCRPNCVLIPSGGQLLLEATKTIPQGTEVTIDYGLQSEKNQPLASLQQRCHQFTSEHHLFTCYCDKLDS